MRFWQSGGIKVPKVKVAQSIKVPYAAESLSVSESECHPYKDMHGGLYHVESSKFITHFYSKNNLIFYKRNKRTNFFEFVPDFIEGSYKFIEFNNTQGKIIDGGKLVFRTTNGDWVLIAQTVELQDNKRYIVAYNVSQNRNLLLVSKENEICSRFLPVISNNIIPIMQFRRDGIFIYLIDLSNEIVHFAKWDLDDMKQLMLEILRICEEHDSIISKVSEDKIDYIHDIMLWRIYGYPTRITSDERAFYISAIKILIDNIQMIGEKYDYALSKFGISLELVGNTIYIYWYYRPFYEEDGLLYIMKKGVICKYPKSEDDKVFYIWENRRKLLESNNQLMKINFSINTKSEGVCLIDEIYRDDFHYITQCHNGVKVVTCGERQDFYVDYYIASVYHYKRYIFMFKIHCEKWLEVIDVYRNFLISFHVEADIYSTVQNKLLYHFYPMENFNKILFLHVQLNFMLILDLKELERIFNDFYSKKDNLGFGERLVGKGEDFLKIFMLKDLIIRAIRENKLADGVIHEINIISHYLDTQHNILFFLVKYMHDNDKITALFSWDISKKDVRFSIVQYSIQDNDNSALVVAKGSKRHCNKHFRMYDKIDLYNIDLHKSEHRFRKLINLDFMFNTKSCFVSVKHNRVSFPILTTDSTRSGFRIENVRDFLFLSFSTFSLQDDHDDNVDINFSSCFILSNLSLVSQIPNVDF